MNSKELEDRMLVIKMIFIKSLEATLWKKKIKELQENYGYCN